MGQVPEADKPQREFARENRPMRPEHEKREVVVPLVSNVWG